MKKNATIISIAILILMSVFAHSHELPIKKRGQTLYIPNHTEFYRATKHLVGTSTNLSFHNIDPSNTIRIISVKGYNSDGRLVKTYLDSPIVLGPLASKNYVTRVNNDQDRVGSSFIVVWESETAVAPPVIESVLLARVGTHGFSLQNSARIVKEHN